MDRREALTALGSIVSATGMTVAPVLTKDAADITMIIFRLSAEIRPEMAHDLRKNWERVCEGTALEGVKTAVVSHGVDVEFVRK